VIAADTDVLIDFLSGVEPGAAQIAGYVAADQLQTTTVTCFELLSGAGRENAAMPSAGCSLRCRFYRSTGPPPSAAT
jgi:predicted nucleic acid-binding protein